MNRKNLSMMKELAQGPKVGFPTRRWREVTRGHSLVILIFAFALVALTGIGAIVADPSVWVLAAAPGTYQISCLTTGPTPEPCLPGPTANTYETHVDTAVLLDAHVTDSSGNLATSGSWIFQDCLLKGVPAPSSACDSGSGNWSNIQEVHLRPGPIAEDVRIAYGIVSAPQTIGFRFRYMSGHQSDIANGISNSMNITWF